MTKYFIHDGEKEHGPFTLIELTSQHINAQTPIWHKGLNGWTEAGELVELQPLLAMKTSPPPFKTKQRDLQVKANPGSGFKVYLMGGIILVAGVLFWYFSIRTGTLPSDEASKKDTAFTDSRGAGATQSVDQRINSEIETKNIYYRNHWSRYIRAKNGNYKRGLLGGINDLEVGIFNETEYVLDEVNVSVHYIKSNGKTYKIEPVEIYNVPPRGKAYMPVPDSDRGTSIKIEINAISSKKMNFCYSSDINVMGSEDPYRCKTN